MDEAISPVDSVEEAKVEEATPVAEEAPVEADAVEAPAEAPAE